MKKDLVEESISFIKKLKENFNSLSENDKKFLAEVFDEHAGHFIEMAYPQLEA